MSKYTAGDERNCRNCQQPIYFGGIHWWHKHNESSFCTDSSLSRVDAEPEMDETERVRAAAPELLKALKKVRDLDKQLCGFDGEAYERYLMATVNAAIAKAEVSQ